MTKAAFYFGCWDCAGHYLHDVTGRGTLYDLPTGIPWSLGLMDGGLLKNGKVPDRYDGRVFWTCGGKPDLWFAFYWWDNSVDKRGASNSGFYVRGFQPDPISRETVLPAAREAFAFACAQFPRVIERQRQPLVLIETRGATVEAVA